jgi:serine/threonine-protein kinase HipA
VELRQLWRRIHGFLRTGTAGWSLSPAFDLNPDPRAGPKYLSTAIDYDSTVASIETLMAVAESFRLNGDDQGLQSAAIDEMAPAFEHEQREIAQRITGSA